MSDIFSSRLSDLAQQLNLPLDHSLIWKLSDYFQLAQKWGAKINITANLGFDEYLKENVLDPLLALQALRSNTSFKPDLLNSILDIGCGGGFTGITWAIALGESSKVTLIDRDRRKINFCRQAIRELALPNAKAHHADFSSFDLNSLIHPLTLVSRATFGASDFFNLANKYGSTNDSAIYFSTPAELNKLLIKSDIIQVPYSIESTARYMLMKNL
jgi:16S rRNA G527 N7-methylase RsmG